MKPVWFNKYEISYQFDKFRCKVMPALARLVPKRLAYLVYIDIGARHMQNDVVPAVPYTVILERLHKEIHR